jgi:hypothetical protein
MVWPLVILALAFYVFKNLDLLSANSWLEVSDRLNALVRDQHNAEIEVSVDNGEVGVLFSRYDGPVTVDLDYHGLRMRIPTTKTNRTNLASCDDNNEPACRVRPGSPLKRRVTVGGDGIYILDVTDRDNDPHLHVSLYIDGRLRFVGDGATDNYDSWGNKMYGPKTRKTDPREVAVDLQ